MRCPRWRSLSPTKCRGEVINIQHIFVGLYFWLNVVFIESLCPINCNIMAYIFMFLSIKGQSLEFNNCLGSLRRKILLCWTITSLSFLWRPKTGSSATESWATSAWPGSRWSWNVISLTTSSHTIFLRDCSWWCPGSASWCRLTSSRAGWRSWWPCSWCWSTSSTTSPPTPRRPRVRDYQCRRRMLRYSCSGLTAIEIWMLSCILFVFGALIGYISTQSSASQSPSFQSTRWSCLEDKLNVQK